MQQKIDLICCNPECKKEFKRLLTEHLRSINIGRRYFCSLSCSKTFKDRKYPYTNEKLRDEFTCFRYFLNLIRNRNKWKEKIHRSGLKCDLQLTYLKNLWNVQNGKCPYTGITMNLPKNAGGFSFKDFCNASLDRIDSSKGYIEGNVEFVCLFINYAKNGFSKTQVQEFITKLKLQGAHT